MENNQNWPQPGTSENGRHLDILYGNSEWIWKPENHMTIEETATDFVDDEHMNREVDKIIMEESDGDESFENSDVQSYLSETDNEGFTNDDLKNTCEDVEFSNASEESDEENASSIKENLTPVSGELFPIHDANANGEIGENLSDNEETEETDDEEPCAACEADRNRTRFNGAGQTNIPAVELPQLNPPTTLEQHNVVEDAQNSMNPIFNLDIMNMTCADILEWNKSKEMNCEEEFLRNFRSNKSVPAPAASLSSSSSLEQEALMSNLRNDRIRLLICFIFVGFQISYSNYEMFNGFDLFESCWLECRAIICRLVCIFITLIGGAYVLSGHSLGRIIKVIGVLLAVSVSFNLLFNTGLMLLKGIKENLGTI